MSHDASSALTPAQQAYLDIVKAIAEETDRVNGKIDSADELVMPSNFADLCEKFVAAVAAEKQ